MPAIQQPILSENGSARVKEAASLVLNRVARNRRLSIRQLLVPLLTQAVYSKCLRADALGSAGNGAGGQNRSKRAKAHARGLGDD